MSETPRFQPNQVQVQRPGAFQTPLSTVDTSGLTIGSAISGLGQALGQTAGTLGRVERRNQALRDEQIRRDDQILAQGAFDRAGEEVGGAMADYETREGRNALPTPTTKEPGYDVIRGGAGEPEQDFDRSGGVTADAHKKFAEIFERHAADMSPQQRQFFSDKFERISFSNYESLQRHEANQRSAAEVSGRQAERAVFERNAINSWANPAAVQSNIDHLSGLYTGDGSIPAEAAQELAFESGQRVWKEVIELVAERDHGQALSLLVQKSDQIGAELSNDILGVVNVHRVDTVAPQVIEASLDGYIVGDITLKEGRELIRIATPNDPDLQNEALKLFKTMVDLERHQNQQDVIAAEEARDAQIEVALAESDLAEARLVAKLGPPKSRDAALKHIDDVVSGKFKDTDNKELGRLRRLANSEPSKFLAINIDNLPNIGLEANEELKEAQKDLSLGKPVGAIVDTDKRSQRVERAVDQYIGTGELDTNELRQAENLRRRVEAASVEHFKTTGTNPRGRELDAIIDREVVIIDDGWISDTRAFSTRDDQDLSKFDADDLTKASQIPRTREADVLERLVHEGITPEGEPPTEAEMVGMFRIMIKEAQ